MAREANETPVASTYRRALEQVKDEIIAIPEQELLPVSLDIAATVITVQGVYPQVSALREQFVRHLPTFDLPKLDNLETYALAMFCAHADYKAATEPAASPSELLHTARITRRVLLADVNALITRDLLPPDVTKGLQGSKRYKNVMMDLGTLASILRQHTARIAGRTSVTAEELTAAEDLAQMLGKATGVREQSPQVIAEAARVRMAAFTLFLRAYERVRAAVHYLRLDEGDADSIVPSLYANRGHRKKAKENQAIVAPTLPEASENTALASAATNPISELSPFLH